MYFRLFVLLVLYLSVPRLAMAASATEIDTDTPEKTIEEFYRLLSFEAGSRPDFDRLRLLLTDDAVILEQDSSADIELLGAEESLRRIGNKIEEVGFENFGLRFIPRSIDCKTSNLLAYCVTSVEVQYPGLDAQPVITTDLSTLEIKEGRWLATSSALFVKIPDINPPSILSYPVRRKTPAPVEGRKWDRPLPFMAQKAIDLGYDLPGPFGISIIPVTMRQDMNLNGLAVSVNGGPTGDIDFVDFATPSVDSDTLQVKLDAWLFPFMNVFAVVGLLDGSSTVPVIIQGEDLMNFINLGSRCDGGLAQPGICTRTLAEAAKPEYGGESYTLGTTLATGWDKMFVALPLTYTRTNLDNKDDYVEAYSVSPRIGVTGDAGNWGSISTFIGATYLDSTNKITDTVTFDTSDSGVPELGDTTTLEYTVDQSNKDKWNYLIGFNWSITQNWGAHAEAGFGGSRSNFISSMTYRF